MNNVALRINNVSELMMEIESNNNMSLKQNFELIVGFFDSQFKTQNESVDRKLQGIQEEVNSKFKMLDEKSVIHGEKISKIESKIDVFKHDDSGQYALFKSTAMARVHRLVGDAGSIEYILFYAPFSSKIYKDIYNSLGASNTGNIKMSDSDKAIEKARTWYPNKRYVRNKIDEYQKKSSLPDSVKDEFNNQTKNRLAVLDKYLQMTNGGNNIEF